MNHYIFEFSNNQYYELGYDTFKKIQSIQLVGELMRKNGGKGIIQA